MAFDIKTLFVKDQFGRWMAVGCKRGDTARRFPRKRGGWRADADADG